MPTSMTFRLTDEQLADTLLKSIIERIGDVEDAGLGWGTVKTLKGNRSITCLGGSKKRIISKDPNVAILVNAYNILKFGEVKRFK